MHSCNALFLGFTGVEIHSFAKQCLFVYQGPRLSVPQSDLCRQIVSKWFLYDVCLTNSLTQRLWIQSVLGRTQTFPSRGLTIYIGFLWEKNEANGNKNYSFSFAIKTAALRDFTYTENMCGKEAHAVWLTAKQPTNFLWIPYPLDRDFWFTDTRHRHITHMFTDATSSLPIYSVRAFCVEGKKSKTMSYFCYWAHEVFEDFQMG